MEDCAARSNQVWDPCYPLVTFPAVGFMAQSLQPEWATCTWCTSYLGLFDPPFAMSSATALITPKITAPVDPQNSLATAGAVPPAVPTATAPTNDPWTFTSTLSGSSMGSQVLHTSSMGSDPSLPTADPPDSKIDSTDTTFDSPTVSQPDPLIPAGVSKNTPNHESIMFVETAITKGPIATISWIQKIFNSNTVG